MVIGSGQGFTGDLKTVSAVPEIKGALMSVESVEFLNGGGLVTVFIPDNYFPLLRNLLQDGVTLVNTLERKFKTERAISRAHDPVEQKKRDERYKQFSDGILKTLDSFLSSGMKIQEAIRQTKQKCNKGGGFLTCGQIEIIARQAGRFRKGRK